MTKIAFFTKKWVGVDKNRPYSPDIWHIRTYIVQNDTRFERLARCLDLRSVDGREVLETVAVKMGFIKLEHQREGLSAFWETDTAPTT